ncbi:DDE-type integrase/transposase/recombinase [Candidatus Phytoplasma prunorum]|uniref:DDE-type integrase/transposase/recombinase n=1 Tax=Candidatus Phytoplasma prunorum TaxID=47565 RepID=UPI002FF062DB
MNLQLIHRKTEKPRYQRRHLNLSNHLQVQPNLIRQNFQASQPYQKLFTDITGFKTATGYVYFTAIIDAFNHQILTWQTASTPNLALITKLIRKLPPLKPNCIIHSDQGAVYLSQKIQKMLIKKGCLISMSRPATPLDNAVIENFFGQMKSILDAHHTTLSQKSPAQIKTILNHFPKFRNQQWILSKLNFTTPIAYLHQHGQ